MQHEGERVEQAELQAGVDELSTIRDVLRYSVTLFEKAELVYGHGNDNPWDEAVSLLRYVLALPLDVNKEILDARLTQRERETILKLVQRRVNERKPVAYLTNEAFFAGMSFFVDERVIIPRSPLAELIENHFAPWVNPDDITRIADIGTGSGCIALSCAMAFPDAAIDAIDVSKDALSVAEINRNRMGLNEQVKLIESDLFTNVLDTQYDIIISNPPYVDSDEMESLDDEFEYEPKVALAGGEDGLDFVIPLLQMAPDYLNDDGILIVEVGNSEAALVRQFPDVPFNWLTFKRGGQGVFLLTHEQLIQYRPLFT